MDNIMVSIIVPVYNKELYLKSCVKSICEQTHNNIEIILVNDGSTDKSGNICDELQKTDSRIKVFHTQNNGVSSARNYGIQHSVGQYLQFCDSDDMMHPTMTQELLKGTLEHNCDLVICGIIQDWESKKIQVQYLQSFDGKCSLDEFFNQFAKNNCHEFFGSNCNKLYRADIVKQNCRFENGLCFAEDFLFNTQYFTKMQSVYVVAQSLYEYKKVIPNSLTKNRIEILEDWQKAIKAYNGFESCFKATGYFEKHEKDVNYFLLFLLDWTFLKQPLKKLWQQRKIVKQLCNLPKIKNAANNANTYKITVKVFKFAIKHNCLFLIYALRFARACFGIN